MTATGDGVAGPAREVVVVGAGPAGASTALGLARRGVDVLLVDRAAFPRPKVCGCCVNPRALSLLAAAGLGDLPRRLGAIPLDSLELACRGGRAVVERPLGVALSREALDAALVDAARDAGAEFLPATAATLLPPGPGGDRTLRLRGGGRSWCVGARSVVSATGLSDSLAAPDDSGRNRAAAPRSKVGAGAVAPAPPAGYRPGRIYMACGEPGYVGLVALEDGRLDLAAALDPAAIRGAGGIGPVVGRILDESGLPPVEGVEALAWKGTPPLTRDAGPIASDRVFRVGDAAGYVEPFTGEGIAWALAGGVRLAELLAAGPSRGRRPAARSWPAAHAGAVRRRQLVCRSARRVLGTPWMTRTLVALLDRFPALATPLIRTIHRHA